MSVNACIWFCQGEILKFALYPYDQRRMHLFGVQPRQGRGVDLRLRHAVRSSAIRSRRMNGAFRAMMDNAGVSSGPQIVIDMQNIEPEDGNYHAEAAQDLAGQERHPEGKSAVPAFPRRDAAAGARQHHPCCARSSSTRCRPCRRSFRARPGEIGTHNVQQTATGMALLHNSANTVFRSIVKNFDDDVTTPDIRRSYDWNMQFNPTSRKSRATTRSTRAARACF